jgi:glycosyltransferase involved in cell wall biosynthesis
MAVALPVVATAVGGTPEVVEHEVTGRLVPARGAGGAAQRRDDVVPARAITSGEAHGAAAAHGRRSTTRS